MKNIQLLETKSEIGAGTRGASLGIDAVKIASLNAKSDYFFKHNIQMIPNQNHLLFNPSMVANTPFAKRINGISQVYKDVSADVANSLRNNQFPIILAGDHSSAGATIAGIRMANPSQRLGVIWMDAHADLHTPYTTPSGNVHGMPLGLSLNLTDEAAKGCGIIPNHLNEETKRHWDTMKNLGGICPKIEPQDIAFVAVRDTEAPENYLIEHLSIRNYTVAEVRQKGAKTIGKAISEQLSDCDLIYISFDVDSLDCDLVSHGTGTPVPDGLSEKEALELLDTLLTNKKVCCFEITEVNPTLDEKRNLMAETAFRILNHATNAIKRICKTLVYQAQI